MASTVETQPLTARALHRQMRECDGGQRSLTRASARSDGCASTAPSLFHLVSGTMIVIVGHLIKRRNYGLYRGGKSVVSRGPVDLRCPAQNESKAQVDASFKLKKAAGVHGNDDDGTDLGNDGTNGFEKLVAQIQLRSTDAYDCARREASNDLHDTLLKCHCFSESRKNTRLPCKKMDNRQVIVRTSASASTFWTRERGEDEVTRYGRVVAISGAATPFAPPRLPSPTRCVSPPPFVPRPRVSRSRDVDGKVMRVALRDLDDNMLDMIAHNKKLVVENCLLRRRLQAAQQMNHVLVDLAVQCVPLPSPRA